MRRREFIRLGSAGVAGAAVLGAGSAGWMGAYAHPVADPGTDGERVVPTFCELCFWKCGILAHVKDGRVTKIKGNPNDPLSNGRLCPRGAAGTGLLYDPDRLRQPLLRRSKRGAQEFQAVSWDDALNETARSFERIKAEYGAGALALFMHGYGASWFKRLFQAYGSPNLAAPSYAQCRGPRDVGFALTYGQGVGSPEITDMARTRCLVLIGGHLGENMHNTQVQEFAEAVRRGSEIIVVDPRYSVAASKATHWLPIRPGTDLALLLAWMNVLIAEGQYDREYLERYAYGFEQLKAHVAPFTPEWAYPRTGLEPESIRRSARAMAGARPAVVVHPGRHATWYGNDTQRARAVAILNALLGSWGREGGLYQPAQATALPYPTPAFPKGQPGVLDRPEPSDYPLADEVLAHGICDASIPGVRGNPRDPRLDGVRLQPALLAAAAGGDAQGDPGAGLPGDGRRAADGDRGLVGRGAARGDLPGAPRRPEHPALPRALRRASVSRRWSRCYDSKPGWWIAQELGKRLGPGGVLPLEGRGGVPADARAAHRPRLGAAAEPRASLPRRPAAHLLRGGLPAHLLHRLGQDRAVLAGAGEPRLRPAARPTTKTRWSSRRRATTASSSGARPCTPSGAPRTTGCWAR